MAEPIDKKIVYNMRYPKGTIIELTENIKDPFNPKKVGDRFMVDYIDDALQLHGHWLPPATGSYAVIIEHDQFKIVTDE